jgi:hypothetical protein
LPANRKRGLRKSNKLQVKYPRSLVVKNKKRAKFHQQSADLFQEHFLQTDEETLFSTERDHYRSGVKNGAHVHSDQGERADEILKRRLDDCVKRSEGRGDIGLENDVRSGYHGGLSIGKEEGVGFG